MEERFERIAHLTAGPAEVFRTGPPQRPRGIESPPARHERQINELSARTIEWAEEFRAEDKRLKELVRRPSRLINETHAMPGAPAISLRRYRDFRSVAVFAQLLDT